MYYKQTDYKLLRFRRSPKKFKKYDAVLVDKQGKKHYVPFSDTRYSNYQDKTGLNLYQTKIHSDKARRANYRARHKTYLREGYYSPGYFSYYYLW